MRRLTGTLAGISGYRLVLPGLLGATALAARLLRLGFQPLWWDEGWSVYFASQKLGSLLELTAVDIHPPFYYLVLKAWISLFGPSPMSLRFLSVCIGVATVLLLYRVGTALLGDRAGTLAAALLAISPFHIYYSQEVRMYALVTLLCLCPLQAALRARTKGWSWGAWLGYVLTATAALYTQYFAAFFLVGLNLAALPSRPRSLGRFQWLVRWASAQLAVLLLFVPWLWYAGANLSTYVAYKVDVESDVRLGLFEYLGRHLSAFHWGHVEGAWATWWWAGLLPLAALLLWSVATVLRRRRGQSPEEMNRTAWLWPLLIVTVVLACAYVVHLLWPFYPPRGERLLLLALPPYLLLVGLAISRLWELRRPLGYAAFLLTVALGGLSLAGFYTVPRYPGDDYRLLADRLEVEALPTDAVICVHPWQIGYFRSYLAGGSRNPELVLTPREILPRERQLWADDPALMVSQLDALLAQHKRLWVPAHQAMGRVLEDQISAALVQHSYPVLSEWYGDATILSMYAAVQTTPQPIEAVFADSIRLNGAALSQEPVESAWGIVAVDLSWTVTQPVPGSLQVGLRLVDESGYVWAQRGSTPNGGLSRFSDWEAGTRHSDHHGLLIPAGTPPAEYRLVGQLYDLEDMAVLPAAFPGGSGGEVVLGTVQVRRPGSSPPADAIDAARSLDASFDGTLRLLGYTLANPAMRKPGEAVMLELAWQALDAPGQDLLPRLQLIGPEGDVLVELTENPVAGRYPTAWWRAGELVRDLHSFLIPARAAPGSYDLVMELVRASDGSALRSRDGQSTTSLGLVDVGVQMRDYEAPDPSHTQVEGVGSAVELVGYDLRERVRAPGSPVDLVLYWHAVGTVDRNYHVFVHLLDSSGQIAAQDDGPPAGGERPSFGWLPGEFVADAHVLRLPTDLVGGEYSLAVGLYDPATEQRLGERIMLRTPIPVDPVAGCSCP